MSNSSQVPGPAFADLGLSPSLLRAISEAGYATPTPIQAKAIPVVLAGGDLLATAQTGTGKTAGFTLPILQRLAASGAEDCKPGRPRCLVLVPTRELATQVRQSVTVYAKYLPLKSMVLFGGVGIQPQIQSLRRRVDILVATPGRLLDHCGQKTVDLSGVEILVLDEADRMLDMGFLPDIRKILARLPEAQQTLLFSATFSEEVRAFAEALLHEPSHVEVAPRNAAADAIEQTVHLVAQQHKRDLLSHLIRHHGWRQVLVFTRTKHGANRLAEKLTRDGITAAAIHGNKSQSARSLALARFKDGLLPVLVATDIAARGLDIERLPYVVNFELPQVPEDYVHRIGRTGRAGSSGTAVSLVAQEEIKLLCGIERLLRRPIPRATAEGFVPAVGSESPGFSSARPRRSTGAGLGSGSDRSPSHPRSSCSSLARQPRRARPGKGRQSRSSR